MAADGTPGAKGNPRFLGSGAPATAVDLNLVSDFAAAVAGETVATHATLPTTGNWIGRTMWVQDVRAAFTWDGASWIPISPHFAYYQGVVSPATGAFGDIPTTQSYSTPGLLTMGVNAVTVTVAGWYRLSGTVTWANNATGSRVIEITGNAAALAYPLSVRQAANSATAQALSGVRYLAAGTVIRLRVLQDSGSTISATGTVAIEFIASGNAPA